MQQRRQQRSPEALEYRKLYKSKRWQHLRGQQLARHPLCEWHRAKGQVIGATVVHHAEPHKGDRVKFFAGPFVSLCSTCHDGPAQSEERLGYSTEIGADGWPIDPRHPTNRS